MNFLEKISLTTIVLCALGSWLLLKVIPSQPVFIGLFFLLVVGVAITEIRYRNRAGIRTGMIAVAIVYVLLVSFAVVIVGRQTGTYMVHDNALQIEASLNYLDQGLNPYTQDFHDSVMGEWDHIYTVHGERLDNPALVHNLKLPFHITFSWPFYKLIPNFDQRIVYFIVFLFGAVALYLLPQKLEAKLLLLTLYSLNPLFVEYFVTGRDDVFILTWLLWTFAMLKYRRYYLSAVFLGFAFASKHSAWVIAPFYATYLFYVFSSLPFRQRLIKIVAISSVAALIFFATIVPFLIWDMRAFVEDILLFPFGALATSYPINGYSLASILVSLGLVENPFVSFPTWIAQLILGVPVFIWVIRQLQKRPTVATLVLGYAFFLAVYWFGARFFHDNHIGFITQLLFIGYFLASASPQSETAVTVEDA